MGYKWEIISPGGVTLFCHAQDPKEGDFTVAWGQNAHYGELAFGQGAVRPSLSLLLSSVSESLTLDSSARRASRRPSRPGSTTSTASRCSTSPPVRPRPSSSHALLRRRPPRTRPRRSSRRRHPLPPPPTLRPSPLPPQQHQACPPSSRPTISRASASRSALPPPPPPPPRLRLRRPHRPPPRARRARSGARSGSAAHARRRGRSSRGSRLCSTRPTTARCAAGSRPTRSRATSSSARRCGGRSLSFCFLYIYIDDSKLTFAVNVLCVQCEAAYHAGCLSPPIKGIPDGALSSLSASFPRASAISLTRPSPSACR